MSKKKWVLAVLFIAIALFCYKRWDVWFGNPPEPGYDIQHHPARVLLTVGPSESSRYVSWQCDSVRQPGWLDLCDTLGHDTLVYETMSVPFRSRAGIAAYFSVLLDSLKADSVYRYRIRVGQDTTAWMQFHMPAASDDYSFLYFGDVQDEVDDNAFDSLLPNIMAHNADASFLLFGGDLIERPMDKYWGKVFASLSSYAYTYPIVSVPGNHEYLKGVTRTLEERFPLVFPYYDMEAHDDNALFSFKQGDARFFLLDSNKDFWRLWSQRMWLEKELSASKEKWKIVVLHHPIRSIKSSMNNWVVKQFFDDLVCEKGVDLVLQGHEHGYARFNVDAESDKGMTEPLRLVSYCSRKDYMLQFHGDVAKWGTDSRYFQRITFSGDTLSLSTFDAGLQLYDRVKIVKTEDSRRLIDEGTDISERIRVSDWFRANKSAKKVKKFEENIEKWRKSKR